MSDDLMRRLRHDEKAFGDEICGEAADEIDRLREDNERLRAKIAEQEEWNSLRAMDIVTLGQEVGRLWEALDQIAQIPLGDEFICPSIARAALAEKGGK